MKYNLYHKKGQRIRIIISQEYEQHSYIICIEDIYASNSFIYLYLSFSFLFRFKILNGLDGAPFNNYYFLIFV